MAYGDDGRYFTSTGKIVSDGNTAYAADLNKVTNGVESGLNLVGDDLDAVKVIAETNSGTSEAYAITDRGTESPTPGKYSSYAYSLLCESYAEEAEDSEVINIAVEEGHEPSDTLSGVYSALHHKEKALDAQTASETAQGLAEGFKDDAETAAANAIAQNSILGGTNITVGKSADPGPWTFTVNAPTSVQESRTISTAGGLTGGGNLSANRTITHPSYTARSIGGTGATVVQTLTSNTEGHVTGATSGTITYSEVGAAALSHTHNYLPLSGGTITGSIYFTNPNTTLNINGMSKSTGNLTFSSGGTLTLDSLSTTTLDSTNATRISQGAYTLEFSNGFFFDYSSTDNISLGSSGHTFKNVRATNFYGVYNPPSDIKLKENIEDMSSDFSDKLMQLRPVTYNWREGEEGLAMGMIAQEVEEVFGEENTIVHYDEEADIKCLRYQELIPVLVKCVQELKQEIDNLKSKLGE